MQKRGDSLF